MPRPRREAIRFVAPSRFSRITDIATFAMVVKPDVLHERLSGSFLKADWFTSLIWRGKARFGARACSHVIVTLCLDSPARSWFGMSCISTAFRTGIHAPPSCSARAIARGGKVRKRTLANLSRWPQHLVEGLRTLLRGGVAVAKAEDALSIKRSLPHGHVAAILGSARSLGLPALLTERAGGAAGRRCRDLVLAMLAERIIAPSSKLATVRALDPDTAASSLGEVLGFGVVQEREVYAALDWLLAQQERIEL